MMELNPLELAVLAQLVQGDRKLNRELRVLCSTLCNSAQQEKHPEETPSSSLVNGDHLIHDNNNVDSDNLVKEGVLRETSSEIQALRRASAAYKELSDWTSTQTQIPLLNEEGTASISRQLLQLCRRLGFIETPAMESSECLPEATPLAEPKKPVKVFCDGVFDLMHAGHFNALRQAAQFGDELYVGVCSDDEVLKAKGVHPLYTVEERSELVRACKWVKDVIVGCPYDIDLKFFKTTGCDFAVHGDDLALNGQGVDCYDEIRKAGFLKIFKRTEGVSTTTIIARLLGVVDTVPRPPTVLSAPTPAHQFIHGAGRTPSFMNGTIDGDGMTSHLSDDEESGSPARVGVDAVDGAKLAMRQTMLSSRRLAQFMGSPKTPPPGARIVYTDGSFDIFHNGHVRIFEKAKAMGDFLIVGIYDDATVRQLKGPGYPIQPMLDRALSVMAMRYVDEVVMGVPVNITEHFVKTFKINTIVRGTRMDVAGTRHDNHLSGCGDVVMIESESTFSTEFLIERIKGNRDRLRSSIAKRQVKEQKFYNDASKPVCTEL